MNIKIKLYAHNILTFEQNVELISRNNYFI
jgi:hypothetical protein